MPHILYDETDFHVCGMSDAPHPQGFSIPAPEGVDYAGLPGLEGAYVIDGELRADYVPPPPPPPRSGLTHQAFRSLLTLNEQVVLDNFGNPAFVAAHPALKNFDVMTLAILTTAYKTYETAQEINLDDPAVPRFIGLLAQLGLLDGEGRAEKILSGQQP
ncbi:hypothetical protein AGMMS50256_11610 [Betaproteobacteria bacterium]|nr:hypothetical protein AGMMS50256_11610 [Betaproteobacteria bacterium]